MTAPDVRLIAVDMDGTLLGADQEVPASLWPLLDDLDRLGILFCPASGRQYARLASQFGAAAARMVFIAENGAYVVRDGQEVASDSLAAADAHRTVREVRRLAGDGVDVGVVLCGKRSAYIERVDARFASQARVYYALLAEVEDLTAVDDEVLKVAVFAFGSAERDVAPTLAPLRDRLQVVVSGENWVDVMSPTADKGAALRALQAELGITPAQTMAFGDYLNDLGLLDAATHSYAMANAHPDVLERARHVAPSNEHDGVVRTVRRVLGLDAT